MSVTRVGTDYPHFPGLGGFVEDFRAAMAAAHSANDPTGAALVSDLWLQQIESVLVGMPPAEFIRHFKSKKAWRVESGRPVYLIGTEPCLAYTPVRYMDGELDVILLGTCYRLPAGGDAAWWTQSIQPRMRGFVK